MKHDRRTLSSSEERSVSHLIFVSHSARTEGAERSLVSLVRAARRMGAADRITVFIPEPGPIEDLLADIPNVVVRTAGTRQWMSPRRGLRQLVETARCVPNSLRWRRIISRESASAVIVNSSVTPGPLIGSRMAGVPAVLFIRESITENSSALRSFLPKHVILALARRAATATAAVSTYVATLAGGVDVVSWPEVSEDAYLAPASATHTPGRIVMLGSIHPAKGQADAVLAVADARRRGLDVTLSIYGGGIDEHIAGLRTLIDEQRVGDKIVFEGPTSDPLGILRGAEASIVCSSSEAYGRVTAESLIVGTPVFGYATGGTAEILDLGGGVSVAPSVQALSDALFEHFSDARRMEQLRRECKARAARRETFGNATRTIEDVFMALSGKAVGARAASD